MHQIIRIGKVILYTKNIYEVFSKIFSKEGKGFSNFVVTWIYNIAV